MEEKSPEAEILARAKEYDEEAIAQIYQKYRDMIYYYGLKVFKNPDDAEEVVAQTFERFMNFLPTIRGGSLKNWLALTARSVISLMLRDGERKFSRIDEIPEEMLVDLNPDTGMDENRLRLTRAREKLPKDYQEVLLLFYDYGYSAKEVAKKLRRSHQAVRLLLHRAREKLREILTKELGGKDEMEE